MNTNTDREALAALVTCTCPNGHSSVGDREYCRVQRSRTAAVILNSNWLADHAAAIESDTIAKIAPVIEKRAREAALRDALAAVRQAVGVGSARRAIEALIEQDGETK